MDKTLVKNFFKYVTANVAGMVALSCYILADTFFVSQALGVNGLSSLNFAIPAFNLINATGLMFGIGGGTRFAVLKARGLHDEADRLYSNTFFTGAIVGGVLMILGVSIPEQIASLLGASGELVPLTGGYLRLLVGFSPVFILNQTVLCFVRNDHNPQLAMTAMVVGSLFNVLFDWVLVIVCNMGMEGAALATVFSPVISLIILSLHFLTKRNTFRLKAVRFEARHITKTLSLGAPSFFVEFAFGLTTVIFNIVIMGLSGKVGVAAYGIVLNLAFVTISLYMGIAQGIQPQISEYYAVAKKKKALAVVFLAISLSLLISAVLYSVVAFKADSLALIFNSENDMTLNAMAANGLKIYFIGFFISGINVVLSQYLNACEKALRAMIISLSRGFVSIVSFLFILSSVYGMDGAWYSFTASELLTLAIALCLTLFSTAGRKNRRQKYISFLDGTPNPYIKQKD